MKNRYNKLLHSLGEQLKRSCVFLMLLSIASVCAQQDAQYTQYMYNTQVINPGYVGSLKHTQFASLYRTQWIGLDGAPETFSFSTGMPIRKNMGLGLSFIQDQIGPSQESIINADYAYAIPVNEANDMRIVFGLKGGLHLLNVDYGKLNIHNPNEEVFQYNINNRIKPMIGAGLYLYTSRWYAGLSVPNMIETIYYDDVAVSNAKQRMTFYGMGGYVFQWNDNLKLKPAILLKMEQGAPLGVDTSLNVLLYEKFTLGVAYRWDASVSALAGFQVFDNVFVGYGYDHEVTTLGNYNSGSHELFIKFELFPALKALSPRFF